MNPTNILLHLSLIKGVGPAFVARILKYITIENLADLYQYTITDFIHKIGLTESAAQLVHAGLADKKPLDYELMLLAKHSCSIVTIVDQEYPALLKQIHLPPTVLYYQGAPLSKHSALLAVVGSREAHQYAQRVVDNIIPPLVNNGWAIVSGGARGADTMAHWATINTGGKTIAVLGSGLLHPYPASNKKLFETIIASGGTVVTPFALQVQAIPGNFPARNRIIAGLSRGCIVVQAAQESGASITAFFALEQGREVFAVPGPIDDLLSAGCHKLIQQGAKLITNAHDIVQEFGQELADKASTASRDTVIAEVANLQPDSLEYRITQACYKPASLDQLVELLQVDLFTLQQCLVDLQLQGTIDQNMAGLWQKI